MRSPRVPRAAGRRREPGQHRLISDRLGGGRVTFWTFVGMTMAVGGVLYFLGIKEQSGAFWGFSPVSSSSSC